MSTDIKKVIDSYCYYNTEQWALFTVNGNAKQGDIFKISRNNLRECFCPGNDDESIPETDLGTKRIGVTFSKLIQITNSAEDDILLFTFDSDSEPKDSFLLTPDSLNH